MAESFSSADRENLNHELSLFRELIEKADIRKATSLLHNGIEQNQVYTRLRDQVVVRFRTEVDAYRTATKAVDAEESKFEVKAPPPGDHGTLADFTENRTPLRKALSEQEKKRKAILDGIQTIMGENGMDVKAVDNQRLAGLLSRDLVINSTPDRRLVKLLQSPSADIDLAIRELKDEVNLSYSEYAIVGRSISEIIASNLDNKDKAGQVAKLEAISKALAAAHKNKFPGDHAVPDLVIDATITKEGSDNLSPAQMDKDIQLIRSQFRQGGNVQRTFHDLNAIINEQSEDVPAGLKSRLIYIRNELLKSPEVMASLSPPAKTTAYIDIQQNSFSPSPTNTKPVAKERSRP